MADKMVGKVSQAQASTAESVKKAIAEMDAIKDEKHGVPEDVEETVKKRFYEVIRESRTDLTGPNQAPDYFWLPEVIKLNNGDERRICKHINIFGQLRFMTPDGQYFLRWCHPGRFDRHIRRGYDFVSYDSMFKDTNFFTKSPENRVRCGDLYLMKISVDGFARVQREKLELKKLYERSYEGAITDSAEKFNTKAFRYHQDSPGDIEFIN